MGGTRRALDRAARRGSVTTPGAAQQVPPDEAWRQFDTDHFTVTYPEPMAETARRAGLAAERPTACWRSGSWSPRAGGSSC